MKRWLQNDPIKKFENYLVSQNLVTELALDSIRKDVEKEIADAHSFAKSSPSTDRKEIMNYVFA